MEFNCEMLGISQEEMQNRVIEAVASRLMSATVWVSDEEGEYEDARQTEFTKKMQAFVKSRIDENVQAVAEEHVIPKVDEFVSGLVLQKTNQWGEPKGESETITEYLVRVCEEFMKEDVDFQGKPKGSGYGSSSFRKFGSRIEYAIDKYIGYHMESAIKEAVGKSDQILAKAMEDTIKSHAKQMADSMSIQIKRGKSV